MKAGRILVAALLLVILIGQVSIVGATVYDTTIIVHKFHDLDRDGVQDAGEPDIEGWLIRIYRAGDLTSPIFEDTTGPDGKVSWTGLNGAFKVWEEMPPCWEPTTPVIAGEEVGLPDGYFVLLEAFAGQTYTVEFGNVDICAGFEGCTPGYWKNHDWPDGVATTFNEAMATDDYPGLSLLDALSAKHKQYPNDEQIRHAAAAYLNCEAGLEYPYCGDFLGTPVGDLVFANEYFVCPLN